MLKTVLKLIVDHNELFWSNVANASATVAFCVHNFRHEPAAEVWVVYLGFLTAHAAFTKSMSMRYSAKKDPE